MLPGSRGHAKERTIGAAGPGTDARSAVTVHREESYRRKGSYVHQSGHRHQRDEDLNECNLEGCHYLLHMRNSGRSRGF